MRGLTESIVSYSLGRCVISLVIDETRPTEPASIMWSARNWCIRVAVVAGVAACASGCATSSVSIRAMQAFNVSKGHYVWRLALDPSGRFLAAIDTGEGLIMWDRISAQRVELSPPQLGGSTTAVAFCPSAPLVAIGTREEQVVVRTLEGQEWQTLKSPLPAPKGKRGIYGLAVSRDGSRVIAGGAGGRLDVWETATGRLLHQINAHSAWQGNRDRLHRVQGGVGTLAIDPHGEWVISGGTGIADRTLRAWDLKSGSEITEFFPTGTEAPPPGASKIVVSSRRRVYAKFAQEVVVWEVVGRVARHVATIGDDGKGERVTSFAVDPLGTYVATGHVNGTIAIRDSDGHGVVTRFAAHMGDADRDRRQVSALAWSPSGEWLASSVSGEGLVRVWRIHR